MPISTIISTISNGISLGAGNYANSVTIEPTGAIEAAVSAAVYEPLNTAGAAITNYGVILTSANTYAIVFKDGGTVSNFGDISGASGVYVNASALLQNFGAINANGTDPYLGDGVKMKESSYFVNEGSVGGTQIGAYVYGGDLINLGSIEGDIAVKLGNDVRFHNIGNVSGGVFGVSAKESATFLNSGVITGQRAGVILAQGAVLHNAGNVYGETGVSMYYGLLNTLDNTGSVGGVKDGVSLTAGGSVINAGTISGGTDAIYAASGPLSINAETGAVFEGNILDSDATNAGLNLILSPGATFGGKVTDVANEGTLVLAGNTAGSLSLPGTFYGFKLVSFAAGATWTLAGNAAALASGIEIAGFQSGDTIILDGFAASSASLSSVGLVLSNGSQSETLEIADGLLSISAFSIVTEAGNTDITGPAAISTLATGFGSGITLGAGNYSNDFTITAAGTLNYGPGPAIYGGYGPLGITLTNAGYIVTTGGIGNYATKLKGRDSALINTGTIIGHSGAGVSGSIFNTGFIEGTGTQYGYGVSFFKLTNTGTIIGATSGILGSGTVENSGVILGKASNGADFTDGGTLINNGMISGNFGVLFIEYYNLGSASYPGYIKNAGDISGRYIGIYNTYSYLFQNASAEIVNTGIISGTIGIETHSAGGRTETVYNSGTISGSKEAILSAGGFLRLYAGAGAAFDGNVVADDGPAELILGGTVAGSLDIGSSFSGFGYIEFAGPAGWILAGTSSDLASGQIITGFSQGDTLVLEGVSASAGSYLSGTGLVLSTGGTSTTLGFSGTGLNTNAFQISSSTDATTIAFASSVTPVGVINRVVDSTVAPGSGHYDAGITITRTGAIISPGPALYASSQAVGVNIVNNGDIRSTAGGVNTANFLSPVFLHNNGTISGQVGIYLPHGGTIVNQGLLNFSGAYTGRGVFGDQITLVNSGNLISDYLGAVLGTNSRIVNTGYIYGKSFAVTVRNDGGGPASASVIYNSGVIISPHIAATALEYSYIHNTGTISGLGDAVYLLESASLNNAGYILGGDYGVYDRAGTRLINTGNITSNLVGILDNAGGYILNAGTISGHNAALISPSDPLTLAVTPGAVFNGAVINSAGYGILQLNAGTQAGSIGLGISFRGFSDISFATNATWTLEGSTDWLASGEIISGFTAGDTIVLDSFVAASESFVTGYGLILSDDDRKTTLALAGSFATSDFTISAENGNDIITTSAGGTAPCFCRGTRIATARGQVRVENLRIGDSVKTTLGPQDIRWIGTRSYDGKFIAGNHLALPVRIRRHALGFNVPSRDLYVSPDHAICEGGVLVHARLLINGVSITQMENVDQVDYFHIELDRHAVIFANNTPTESFLDTGCRYRFQNAATAPAAKPGKVCLPRLEHGYYLARIKSRLDRRAGIKPLKTTGPLRGFIDEAGSHLRGWVQDIAARDAPVELDVLLNGKVMFRLLANRYRQDLRAAGLGSGNHAFDIPLPPIQGTITLRRATDRAAFAEQTIKAA